LGSWEKDLAWFSRETERNIGGNGIPPKGQRSTSLGMEQRARGCKKRWQGKGKKGEISGRAPRAERGGGKRKSFEDSFPPEGKRCTVRVIQRAREMARERRHEIASPDKWGKTDQVIFCQTVEVKRQCPKKAGHPRIYRGWETVKEGGALFRRLYEKETLKNKTTS